MAAEHSVIPESHADLVERPVLAHVATLGPKGEPQNNPVWFDMKDGLIRFSQTTARQKFRNVQADPRVTVTVFEADNPYRYVEARGVVAGTQDGPPAADSINELSEKYTGGPYGMGPTDVRVILFIDVQRVHKSGF